MDALVPIVLGGVGAVVSAVGAYALARRQRSGNIDTSQAETLWAESQSMRRELRDETVMLRQEMRTLRAEAVALREEAVVMRVELVALRRRNVECDEQLERLHRRLRAMEGGEGV